MRIGICVLFILRFSPGICLGLGLLDHVVILFFLRILHILFHSGCLSLHSHQLCMSVPFPPCLHRHLLFAVFMVMAILTAGRQYHILILICFSLVISNVEHSISFLKSLVRYNIKIISFSSNLSCSFDSNLRCGMGHDRFLLHFYSFLNPPLCVSRLFQGCAGSWREDEGTQKVVIQPSALHRVRVS